MLNYTVKFNNAVCDELHDQLDRESVGAGFRKYSVRLPLEPLMNAHFWSGCVDLADGTFLCTGSVSLYFDELIDRSFKGEGGVVTFIGHVSKDTVTVDLKALQLTHDVMES